MTNQQGAPEALRVEAAYGDDGKFIGYRLLSSGANGGLLVWADQKAMPGFRIGDHFVPGYREVIDYKPVALVEAQQPAAHVENPGEIEHVAGDVSKNGLESNMAQRPAPSAAATVGEVPLPLLVRDIAADLGTTPIQVCTALAQLGFGGHSVNMAVTPRMAKSLRAHFASTTPQADSQPAPIDMVLHCPKCGMQHIDEPDWQNDPQLGAIRYANAQQRIDTSGDREAQQSHHEPVQVLLRDGGMASGGHAEQPVQEVQLPATAIHEANKSMHVVSSGNGRFTVLQGQQNGQPSSEVQGLPQERNRRLEEDQSGRGESGGTSPKQSAARDEAIRLDARGVSGAPESSRADLQHLREGRASEAQEGPSIAGSLPCNGQDSGRAVLSLQHDAGLRERRLNVASQRDQVSCEAPLRAPIHRSHLCRPEDGGCGHIWRPADVPTNGVKAVKTTGKADSPIAARAQADSQPAPVRDESAARDECKRRWLAEDEDCNLLEAYDRGWKDRAARAPADSVTAPAAGAVAGPGVPVEVTDAVRAAGFTLLKVPNGYSLLKLGDVRAQSQPPCNMLIKRGEWDSLSTGAKALLSAAAAPTPPAQAADSVLEGAALSQAARDVLAERQRQISAEGWTPEHDDEQHLPGELALAAASYVCADENDAPPAIWPWALNWWKPRDRRRNLTKAGALILAEMELLDRAARKQGANHD